VNAFLIIMKAVVAIITGSIAILAELAHSLFDMLASIFAYVGIKKAEEPADKTHLYGHEKFENLSSFAQTILIVVTSMLIIYEALNRIGVPKKLEATELGLIVMFITIVIDYFLSRYLHGKSKEYGSTALEADAYHFTTDLWGALSVIIGLGFVFLGFQIFDAIAAMVVAIIMLWISYGLGKRSINVLMDGSPSYEVIERISRIIASTHGVFGFHNLKARYAGKKIFLDFNIHVAPKITARKAHEIAHKVEKRLIKEIPNIKQVTIHIEPSIKKQ